MYILSLQQNASGGRPSPQSWTDAIPPEGYVMCPDSFIPVFASAKGFVRITVADGIVTTMTENTEAREAWEAANKPDLFAVRQAKLQELSTACNATITAGCPVTLSDATKGYISMTDEDQINLMAAQAAVQAGATGYPYHLDGDLCKVYPAADIVIMATAATKHKLYHTTYCNHLNVWVRRCETVGEVQAITYGAELPADLAANLAEVLSHAG